MQNFLRKHIYLSVIFCLPTFLAQAQTEYLVTVDPGTGSITKVDSIPGVTWLRSGYMPAYSQTSHQYTVVGGESMSGMFNLISVDAITGHTLLNPEFNDQLNFTTLQYTRNSDLLYGATYLPDVSLYLLNKATATHTLIKNYPEMNQVLQLFPDDVHNRIYISAISAATGDRAVFTIEMNTGNILSEFPAVYILNWEYNYTTKTLYGVYYSPINNNPPTFTLCRFDPNTGIRTDIAAIPQIINPLWGYEALDEVNGRYFIGAFEWGDSSFYLNTVDIATGNLLHKVIIPVSANIDADNLAELRYDQALQKLYALFWEAHTIPPPPPPTPVIIIPVDSSCSMDSATKVYPLSSGYTLIVDKKITACRVSMNLFNMAGQLLMKNRMINDGYNEIPLAGFSAGIYFYQFISEGRVLLSGRFLKQ